MSNTALGYCPGRGGFCTGRAWSNYCGLCAPCWAKLPGDAQAALYARWTGQPLSGPVVENTTHIYPRPRLLTCFLFGVFCAAAGAGLVVAALEWIR